MSNILITGVNGFLGAALARDLDKDNRVVGLGFDKHKKAEPSVSDMIYGDVRDRALMARILSEYEISDVYHMAAQSIVRVCETNPASAYDINVMGTVSLLDACRTTPGIKSITVSTSDKVYGHACPPYHEDTPFEPRFIYETSKACQDLVARSFAESYGLPVKVVRCSNIYGPGDLNLSRLIPRSIMRLLNGESPILYDGVHNYTRDFVYIDDAVSAFRTISKYGRSGEAYCVGTEKQYKILDVIDMIRGILGSDIQTEIVKKFVEFQEIEKQWMSCEKMTGLNWSPKIDLYEGLTRTIEYYKQ